MTVFVFYFNLTQDADDQLARRRGRVDAQIQGLEDDTPFCKAADQVDQVVAAATQAGEALDGNGRPSPPYNRCATGRVFRQGRGAAPTGR